MFPHRNRLIDSCIQELTWIPVVLWQNSSRRPTRLDSPDSMNKNELFENVSDVLSA